MIMKYLTVAKMAKLWNIPERTLRNYCAQRKIDGAFIQGKTWYIPENAGNPRKEPKPHPWAGYIRQNAEYLPCRPMRPE